MQIPQIAISVEHDFRYGVKPDPLANFMEVDRFRRILEETVDIKQEGTGLFIANPSDKETIYKVIDHLSESGHISGLTIKFYNVEPLRKDFDDWKKSMLDS
jgi:hypothetical protein